MWFLLACAVAPAPLTRTQVLDAARTDGWEGACSDVRSEGVDTTACTLRRDGRVGVVTLFRYERDDDAERAWSGGDAIGRRDGRHVVQVDVFDTEAAQALLLLDEPALEHAGFTCEAGTCTSGDADRHALVAPAGGRVASGYQVLDDRVAAVLDRRAARTLMERLPR